MKPYYQQDGITIYHGDCREILPTLPKVDLVLTDPPYGIAYEHGSRKGGTKLGFDGVAETQRLSTLRIYSKLHRE